MWLKNELESGMELQDVEVDFSLPMCSDHSMLFTERGRVIISKGWKKAGIAGLLDGTTVLPPEDPFECIDNQLIVVVDEIIATFQALYESQ